MTAKKAAAPKKPRNASPDLDANKAMVETDPALTAAPPPVDQPVTLGKVNTTGSLKGDGAADPISEDTVKGSRDERHDSINPHTGTLTEEAVALRAERDNK